MAVNEERVNTYRKNNKRCRTCRFAQHSDYFWFCSAKQKSYHERLTDTCFRGMFCGLYEARKFGEK